MGGGFDWISRIGYGARDSMINKLHSVFHRPEKGWDPIPSDYALAYAQREWETLDETVVDKLEEQVEGLAGKTVLDLGGGPGQFSVAFARRGAHVTWHDISSTYMAIAKDHTREASVDIEFSLGYLEDASRFITRPFELVFIRICWYYCMNDFKFAKLVYSLVQPGGAAYIDSNNSDFANPRGMRRLTYWMNNHAGIKLGHPLPPRGRIAALLSKYPIEYMIIDYTSALNDKIFFKKTR